MSRTNPNCDGGRCKSPVGEVRVLPVGGDGNAILCRDCFEYELLYRRARNLKLEPEHMFDLPMWEDLKVYNGREATGGRG